jgi:two-component system response regulator NreC
MGEVYSKKGYYRERGMEKLGLASRSELLRYAARKGWI